MRAVEMNGHEKRRWKMHLEMQLLLFIEIYKVRPLSLPLSSNIRTLDKKVLGEEFFNSVHFEFEKY